MNTQFIVGLFVAFILTAIPIAGATSLGWIENVSFLEMFAVYTSYLCTYLCVVESRWNYPVGVITTLAYSALFFQSGLIGSAVVSAYLMIQLAYGWFRWGPDNDSLPVTKLSWDVKTIGFYALLTGVTYGIAVWIITYFGGTIPPADAFIMIGTILAQWLLDNKKLDTWKVWFLVNIAAIWLYSASGLFLVSVQYTVFLVNTIFGYLMWKRSMNYGVMD